MAANKAAVILDVNKRHKDVLKFQKNLSELIKGQPEAIEILTDVYEYWLSKIFEKDKLSKPISSLLFLGPTGTGKTKMVESVAELIHGDPRAMLKIDCAEFQQSHDVSKLIGAPPGYTGYKEKDSSLLSQSKLDKWHTEKCKVSLVLFDEIEKASEGLSKLLLGVLDKGKITLGDGSIVDFSKSIIFFTSNLGSNKLSSKNRIGLFEKSSEDDIKDLIKSANAASKKYFSLEFFNRLDYSLVFNRLTEEAISEINEIELNKISKKIGIFLKIDEEVKFKIIREGFSEEFGARYLKRYLEKNILRNLIRLKMTEQIEDDDLVLVRLDPVESNIFLFEKID